MAVLLTSGDPDAEAALTSIRNAIAGYWQRATALSADALGAYRDAWQRKQPVLRNVLGKFGSTGSPDQCDGGKPPIAIELLQMSWADYYARVRSEKEHLANTQSMEARLRVIRAVRGLFAAHQHFSDINPTGRQQIAGLTTEGGAHFLWFGGMRGSGKFWQAINNNNPNLALALDLIPTSGKVSKDAYLGYIEHFKDAFPEGRHGIATATRLLAMKRPDTFVCFNARNREGLCDAIGMSQTIGYENYWDSIIQRIQDSVWWCSSPTTTDTEREVWDARAAFIDSLFYDGKDMPTE